MSEPRILRSCWWVPLGDLVGAVAVGREDGWKAYIGTAYGLEESQDERHIMRTGAGMAEHQARGLFPQFADKPYSP